MHLPPRSLPRTTLAALVSVACLSLPLQANAALDPALVPPINASVGTFNLPLTCAITVPLLFNAKVWNLATSAAISGAVPSSIGPGQNFYLTQGSGSMTIPAWITSLAPIIGAKSANVTLTEINIGALGASPEVINIAASPMVINGIPITAGKPLTAGLPATGDFSIGPWTAPADGLVRLNFSGAKARVDMVNSKGNKVITVNANCSTPAGTALLTMEVGGPAGQPDAKVPNTFVKYPALAANNDNGVIVPPYRCTLDGREVDIGIAFGAGSPLKLGKDNTLRYTNAAGALILPPDLVNALMDQGVSQVSGAVRQLMIQTEGATVPSVDVVAANPGKTELTPLSLQRDQPFISPTPASGTLTIPPIVKTSSTATLRMSAGEAAIDLYYNGQAQAHRLSCGAPSPRIFLGASPL